MTTKPPSRLAASGPADEADEQITKEHSDDDDQDISVDPSEDVTVEATEDVTTEAASSTPHPTLRPGAVGGTPIPRPAPTLLGVPIQSLPLPGVTAATAAGDGPEMMTREINYDDEITVLANPAPADPLANLDAKFDALEAGLDALDRPSITDDDEEETKVEPAEAAMKAAETSDDVTTALSAQASLEREKALRRSVPPSSPSDDLEFADPEADDEEEESLDDELDDGEEVISAGGAVEEEEDVDDADDGENDGVATATFMKPVDSTGLSGLLNPRRPPSGFGQARLPTPYPPPTVAPAPSTSPFASRLGPAPAGSPYSRPTGAAIQIPAPSGKATTEDKPSFLNVKLQVPAVGLIALVGGCLVLGYSIGALTGKRAPAGPTVIVAKPTATPAAPVAPVVEPVTGTGVPAAPAAEAKPGATAEAKPAAPTPAIAKSPEVTAPGEKPNAENPEEGLWKQAAPAAKKPAAPKARKPAVEASDEEPKPKPAVATSPKPVTPKTAVAAATTPKPAPAAKPAKKAAKVWVDPFAN
jgi:hypothetical protein